MFYISYPQPEHFREMTLDELLNNKIVDMNQLRVGSKGGTKTFKMDSVSEKLRRQVNVNIMIQQLAQFNQSYEFLFSQNRNYLYRMSHIPKKKGGLREINEPVPALKTALTLLKNMLDSFMPANHHNAAYAYIDDRSTVEAVKKHQRQNNYWFAKFDLHDFFGSTTLEFILMQFENIYPFNLIMQDRNGHRELGKALSLCMLRGGLPQGSPISPWLTNVIMIPFDYELTTALRSYKSERNDKTYHFCYTRYADDMDISCEYTFDYHEIEHLIIQKLNELGASFQLNRSKTEYGSRAGHNYILGIKLNKDNELSIGYERKKEFEAKLTNYILSHGPCGFNGNYDPAKRVTYTLNDVQKLNGLISYYTMIEPERTKALIQNYEDKFKVNLKQLIDFDLKNF